jgi:hypothetical protein
MTTRMPANSAIQLNRRPRTIRLAAISTSWKETVRTAIYVSRKSVPANASRAIGDRPGRILINIMAPTRKAAPIANRMTG